MTAPPLSGDPEPGLPLVAAGLSHPGQQRPENEDAFGSFVENRLFIVADGMGGHNAGEVAAAMTIDGVEGFFTSFHTDPRQIWPYGVDRALSLAANLLRVGIKVCNDKIREAAAADRSRARMGATVVAMAVGEKQVAIAHAGDSRAYRLRDGELKKLTRDHSIAEEMRAARPEMTDEELAGFAHRNVVMRSLGSKDELEPDVYVNKVAPGDLYLLCTDGLWGAVPDAKMATILKSTDDIEAACQLLVDAANEAGGPDNITALLVRLG
jgi:serine/threonine protein phosphatase PrpC